MCGQLTQNVWDKKILGVVCDYYEEQLLFGMMVWLKSGMVM